MRSSVVSWLGAAAIPVGSAAVVVAETRWRGSGPLSALVQAQLAANVFLVEVALLVAVAPVAGVLEVVRARWWIGGRPNRSVAVAVFFDAWDVARPLVARVTALTVTSALIALVLRTPSDATTLAASHAILWVVTLALTAIGALCGAAFREPLDAAACALVIALTAALGLFGAGPALEEVPRGVLNAALVANPIVAAAAAGSIDIFRTEPLYQLSPLAHTQIDYPATQTTFTWYVLAALVLFLGTARRLRRMMNVRLIERMSA